MSAAAPRQLLWLVLGFVLWSSALVALYALHAIGCAYGWSQPAHRFAFGGVLAAHLVALALALIVVRRRLDPAASRDGALIGPVVVWTLWAAVGAMIFTFLPSLVLIVCV